MTRSLAIALVALPLATDALAAPPPQPGSLGNRNATTLYATMYGGYVGATSGYLMGEAMERTEQAHLYQGIAPGLLVGMGAGLGTGLLLSSSQDASAEQIAILSSGSALGIFAGEQLGRTFIPLDAPGARERIRASGLAGSMAGTGVGMLTSHQGWALRDTVRFDLAALVGWQSAAGMGDLALLDVQKGRRARAPLALLGAGTFAGVSVLASRGEPVEETTVALAMGHGAWLGAWSPLLLTGSPTATQHLGGMRVGLGLGYASALAMQGLGQPSPCGAALQSAAITAGNALGAGIPLSLGAAGTSRPTVGSMLATGVAAQLGAAALAPHYELSQDDAFLVSTLGAWTAYQAGGWYAYAASTDDRPTVALGHALAAGGGGTLVTMGLAPLIDVSPSGSFMLLAGGGWGTWTGAWAANIADLSTDQAWLAMLGAGNGAVLATALLQGAGWQPTWRDVGTINGLGALGAAAGGLAGVIFLYQPDDWDPLAASTLVGTAAGLGTGAVLAGRSRGGATGLPSVAMGRRRDTTVQPQVSARPWRSDAGEPGGYVEVRVDGW